MMDSNAVIRKYLDADVGLGAVVGDKIHCPRLPENAVLPALGFMARGGSSTPYIPGLIAPSVQFDCWGSSPIEAREVYRALYDALQGIQDESVTIGADTFYILSAREEVQGQDLIDADIPGYFRVLTFFEIMLKGG